jgi:uncharacterized integral membrane protein
VGITLAILAIVVVGAVVGSTLNFAGVFLGLPIVFLFIGAVIGKETMDRQMRIMRMKRFRRDARARKIDFDPADKRTLATSDKT